MREIFFKLKWFEVYDLIEFVVDNVRLGGPPELQRKAVNEILEREASGYRFVAGSLAPISAEVELEAIDGAVAAADDQGLRAVSGHIRTAVAKLRERPDADYRNAIKEATSAVESAAKLVTGIERGGLKPALENLAQRTYIHEALRDSLVKLTGMQTTKTGSDTRPWRTVRCMHARASSIARLISARLMSCSRVSRCSPTRLFPVSPAMLSHMCPSKGSLRTPTPLAYLSPRSYCARAWPFLAARRYERTASVSSWRTPSPLAYNPGAMAGTVTEFDPKVWRSSGCTCSGIRPGGG